MKLRAAARVALPVLGLTVVFALCSVSCEKKPAAAKTKPPKKKELLASTAREREALNQLSATLRALGGAADAPPPPAASRQEKAQTLHQALAKVPDKDFPEPLQAPWREMLAVLEAAAQQTPATPSPELQQRGAAAASALNAALAKEGLTDFQF